MALKLSIDLRLGSVGVGRVVPRIPIIGIVGTLSPFETTDIEAMPEVQDYFLSGESLSATIEITPPTGYEVSTDMETWSAAAIEVAADYSGTIYVRMNVESEGVYFGNITHTSEGAEIVSWSVGGCAGAITMGWDATDTVSWDGTDENALYT